MTSGESSKPQSIGPYKILRELGRGGMGVVYEAHDEILDRSAAIKVVHESYAQDSEFIRRFFREARSAAKVCHPNLVTVYVAGNDGGRPYMAMEYVQGRNLTEVLVEEGPPRVSLVLQIVREVAAALACIHGNGLVHRDIKPSNILLDLEGRARVTDFGLAKAIEGATRLTDVGAVIGTPAYIAPELYNNDNPTCAVDIYALGITFYELLAGVTPFAGATNIGALVRAVMEQGVPDIRKVRPDVPPQVAALIACMTARGPESRTASAEDVIKGVVACELSLSNEVRSDSVGPTVGVDEPTRPNGVPTWEMPTDIVPTEPNLLPPSHSWRHMRILMVGILSLGIFVSCAALLGKPGDSGGFVNAFWHGIADCRYWFKCDGKLGNHVLGVEITSWSKRTSDEKAQLLEDIVKDLRRCGAAVIGLDVLLDDASSITRERRTMLLESLGDLSDIVFAAQLDERGAMISPIGDPPNTGYTNVREDWNRVRRAWIGRWSSDGEQIKSFAAALAEQNGFVVPDNLANGMQPYIGFDGIDQIEPVPFDRLPPPESGLLKDKIVIVGAVDAGDMFATPLWGRNAVIPGLSLHVVVLDALMGNRWLNVAPPYLDALIIAVAVLISIVSLRTSAGFSALPFAWITVVVLTMMISIIAMRYAAIVTTIGYPLITPWFVGILWSIGRLALWVRRRKRSH